VNFRRFYHSPVVALPEDEVFSAIGEEGFTRLVAAFYRRVPADDVLGPMYPADDWAGAEQRLRDFLIFRFGGSKKYLAYRGHPRLGMRHRPFPIGRRARDRWLSLMEAAMAETQVPVPAAAALRAFFQHVATFLVNRPEE
jgi:hemoglobin